MIVTLTNVISEIKTDFKSYYSSGLLDDISMERWGLQALKMFGVNIMTLQDELITIENGEGNLPDNFFSLHSAYECEPLTYEVKTTPVIQNIHQWKETNEKIKQFNSCEPCCVIETEKIITEKFYNEDKEYIFKYRPNGLLKLSKNIKHSCYADSCRNKFIKDNINEISIRNLKIYTNYKKGNIYLIYFGLEHDEDGDIIIYDTPRGALLRYVEDYIKYKAVEKIVLNQDDTNLASMLSLLKTNMNESYNLAQADAKFSNLTPESFKRLKMANAKDMFIYENSINRIKKY